MIYFLACLLTILSGLTFTLTAPLYDVAGSDAWMGSALAFGLIVSALPVLKKNRTLKDAMITIALFAAYTAAITSIRNDHRRGHSSRSQLQIKFY